MVPPVSGGITKTKKWTTVYPNIPSALRPVPHGEGIPVPEPPKEFNVNSDDEDEFYYLPFPTPCLCARFRMPLRCL